MKKVISMLMVVSVMLICVLQPVAADTVYRPDSDGKFSIDYEDEKIVDGESYGFVVIEGLDNEILDLSDNNLEKVLYIDQTEASDGSVNFDGFILKGKLPSEEGFVGGTAFIGGEGFDTATTIGTLQKSIVAVSGVTLDKSQATILQGETITLAATVAPDNATDKTVTWTSSDSTIASVDANGVVRGEKASDTPVTITATASGFTATCVITVEAPASGGDDDNKVAGDVTGDGNVNIADALLICRKIAGHDVVVDTDVADVTGDGNVNIADALLICRKIAGHDVTLK